jgi:hypothetical protein
MIHSTPIINPFFATRLRRTASSHQPQPSRQQDRVLYARLPRAPQNASPVPHLTSLYHFHRAGEYGDRKWPGNCGGNLIKDLLLYFKPGLTFDPCCGSGTASDVCRELGIPCLAFDIHEGFDACDPNQFPASPMFDFIWAHPPYWRQKLYADDPRDLSRSPTLEHPPLRPVHPQLRSDTRSRRQARYPHGRLLGPRGRVRPAGVSHQAPRLRGGTAAALHRHHSLQPRGQQFEEGLSVGLHSRPARRMHDL